MELHNIKIAEQNQKAYQYTNRLNTYDPNLSSAARYSPPYSTAGVAVDATAPITTSSANTQESNEQNAYENVTTYNNVIFVPNNVREEGANTITECNNEQEIHDNSQHAYILASDPRFFNTYIRTANDQDDGYCVVNGNDPTIQGQIVQTDPENHQINGYHIQTDEYTIDDHHQIDPNDPHATSTQIILQLDHSENGHQFYRSIQNVYVNDEQGNAIEIIPGSMLTSSDHLNGGYENHQQFQNYHEIETELINDKHYHHDKSNNMIVVPHHHHQHHQHHGNEEIAAVEMVEEEVINNGAYHQPYKNEYTVLEPMNKQMLERHQQQIHNLQDVYHYEHHNNEANLVEMVNMHHQSAADIELHESAYRPSDHLTLEEKEQQRMLLESAMSPLLAAVNDITSRDEHLQNYLAQSTIKEDILTNRLTHFDTPTNTYLAEQPAMISSTTVTSSTTDSIAPTHQQIPHRNSNHLKITNMRSVASEYVDINDMEFIAEHRQQQHHHQRTVNYDEFDESHENLLVRRSSQRKIKKNEELMVADKQVPRRAWASLPTTYLYIGKGSSEDSDYKIFSKKDIPLRTKFGPIEGELKMCSIPEMHQIKTEAISDCKPFPLLLIDQCTILDVSNEYTSNWMRFVNLAKTFSEQNLLLYESEKKIYFKSCQLIHPKQELKVGYSQEYAEQNGLPFLQPNDQEKAAIYERWPCFECDRKFETFELLQTHLNEHEDEKPAVKSPRKNGRLRRRRGTRTHLSTRKISGPTVRYACCYCSKVFSKFISFKRHNEFAHSSVDGSQEQRPNVSLTAAAGPILQNSNKENRNKVFKCDLCRRYFTTAEILEKHLLVHCATVDSKLVQCQYCPKRVLTPSALAMHVKSHIFKTRRFNCLFCSDRFDLATEIMAHVKIHMENGFYHCEHCKKKFKEYAVVRKHVRSIHTAYRHSCSECGREFRSLTKLKEHRLSHSDIREFLCSECGKQFKRKDKLRAHILATHYPRSDDEDDDDSTAPIVAAVAKNEKKAKEKIVKKKRKTVDKDPVKDSSYVDGHFEPQQEEQEIEASESNKPTKFLAKVAPTDYQRFIYKCHDCLLGFKRRGMLVNHLAKRHPDISIDSVPELNLPILKAQRYFYCQYCDKVYKSSSKRKAHILKLHPGLDLPMSSHKAAATVSEPGAPNPAFCETVGNVTTHPQLCPWCHKQYASKQRLINHQRKMHEDQLKEMEMSMHQHENLDLLDDVMPQQHQQTAIESTNYINSQHPSQHHHHHHQHHQHHYIEFEQTENKLLKLSSAALEASLHDDFDFFNEKQPSTNVDQQQIGEIATAGPTLSKVDVNFKVIGGDFIVDPSTVSNVLPQLFEEIDYMSLKSVVPTAIDQHPQQYHHHHQYHQRESTAAMKKMNNYNYSHHNNEGG